MKKFIIVTGLILFTLPFLFAQPKAKSTPEQTEDMPSQSELEQMMKEAQNEMDNLDPEAKRMMDSMGIKMPSFDNMPQITDAQLKEAYENENRIVPKKDVARIASISNTLLTNATLPLFLSGAHAKVLPKLNPASKTKGEEIYKLMKTTYNSVIATGNTALGLWMIGKSELALYVAGKVCIENPTNTDNLNNYASMLSMSGGEQLSLPLLHYVNKRFPKNSTVLNNIGQAWFGLGDINKADSYLDSTIRMYALHPQANYTKSFIEESKDHKAAAIEAVKCSIKKSYSQEKENRLNKLGHKLKGDDLTWDRPMPQDALALEKFGWPDYPKNVNESNVLEKEWDVFKEKCHQEIAALRIQEEKLETAMLVAHQKRMQHLLQASQKGQWVDAVPSFAPEAMIKLQYLIEGKDGHMAVTFQKKGEALQNVFLQVSNLEDKLSARLEVLKKKYEDEFGEGKSNPFAAACEDENGAKNVFLSSSNTILQQAFADYLSFVKRKINDEVYYYQYTVWPEDFERAKVSAKITWLTSISLQKPMFQNRSTWCQPAGPLVAKPFKLSAFDDVHCRYHSQLTTPVGTIRTDCSRMTTELDLKFVKLGLKQDMDKETFGDQFMTCSVEVGAGVSVGSANRGPIKAEASVGGSMALEFDRTGLKDVIVKGAAGVTAGTDIISEGTVINDLQIEAGIKGQVSLISGNGSVGGTGVLAGVF